MVVGCASRLRHVGVSVFWSALSGLMCVSPLAFVVRTSAYSPNIIRNLLTEMLSV